MFTHIRKSLTILALLVCVSGVVRAQNHTQTLSVTNSPLTITADGNYTQILVRENAASPTAVFSITLAGSATALNYPAGTQFIFYGNFVNGAALGAVTATTSGPFSFVAVESNGTPSMSVKNTILSGGTGGGVSTVSSGNLSPLFTVNITNPTTTPAFAFTLSNAAANTVFANCTTGSAAPSFCSITGAMLPVPSASTLGGVESLSVVAHNFLTGISTLGVPTQSQPAFTDISGSIAPSQLPNPSASTLGGVESVATVANNFVTGISTSGVPSLAQPLISNLAGAGAAVTLTEAAAGDVITISTIETGASSYGTVIKNANSANNNSSGALYVSTTGTSTGAATAIFNQVSGSVTGDILDLDFGCSVTTAGVTSGCSNSFAFNIHTNTFTMPGGGAFFITPSGANNLVIQPGQNLTLESGGGAGNFVELQGECTTCFVKVQAFTSQTSDLLDMVASNGSTVLSGFSAAGALQVPSIINITSGHLLISGTAPTISSGFGATSPSIASQNGTAAFTINVGTGTIASTGVIGLPTATTGWSCQATDLTTTSTTVFMTKQTATTASSATLGNFGDTGTAGGWTASDILSVHCTAY